MLGCDGTGRDFQACWRRVQEGLKSQYGAPTYESWFSQIEYLDCDGSVVKLAAPTRFMRDWISSQYFDDIVTRWRSEAPDTPEVEIVIANGTSAAKPPAATSKPAASRSAQPSRTVAPAQEAGRRRGDVEYLSAPLDPKLSFDNFVVGKSNEFAYAAARRVAEQAEVTFNPLFLYGPSGLGKTHLMHAIAWELKQTRPDRKVLYLSAEKFMFHFIQALRYKDTIAFKEKFRAVDVLMVDDVQFIGNKDSTQDEFFHTFNALIDQHRQVVISADRSPGELGDVGVEERVRQRLGKGLTADVHLADYELRLGILQSKRALAQRDYTGLHIPDAVLEFIAHKISSNARDLEGALNKLVAHATFVGVDVTLESAQDLLRDQLRAHERRVTIDEIQRQACDFYKVRMADLLSPRRSRAIARPRQIAMYLSKTLTTASLPEIGRKFGGRDHTTVMHAVRKIEQLIAGDTSFGEEIDMLRRILST